MIISPRRITQVSETDQPASRDTQAFSRPRSVTILAWLQMLQSLALLGVGGYLVIASGWFPVRPSTAIKYLPLAMFDRAFSGAVLLCLAIVGIIVSAALLRLRSWAWMAAMSIQGIGLLAALVDYFYGKPNYIGMFVGVILVFYLNQQEVQAAFRENRGTELTGQYNETESRSR